MNSSVSARGVPTIGIVMPPSVGSTRRVPVGPPLSQPRLAPLRAVPMTVICPLKPPPHPFPCTHRRDIACSFSLSLTCVAVGLLYAGRGSGAACGHVVKPAVCRRRCDRRARHLRPIRLASCGLHSSRCIGRQCLARMHVALFKAAAIVGFHSPGEAARLVRQLPLPPHLVAAASVIAASSARRTTAHAVAESGCVLNANARPVGFGRGAFRAVVYCAQPLDVPIQGTDGFCGPTNGRSAAHARRVS